MRLVLIFLSIYESIASLAYNIHVYKYILLESLFYAESDIALHNKYIKLRSERTYINQTQYCSYLVQ